MAKAKRDQNKMETFYDDETPTPAEPESPSLPEGSTQETDESAPLCPRCSTEGKAVRCVLQRVPGKLPRYACPNFEKCQFIVKAYNTWHHQKGVSRMNLAARDYMGNE